MGHILQLIHASRYALYLLLNYMYMYIYSTFGWNSTLHFRKYIELNVQVYVDVADRKVTSLIRLPFTTFVAGETMNKLILNGAFFKVLWIKYCPGAMFFTCHQMAVTISHRIALLRVNFYMYCPYVQFNFWQCAGPVGSNDMEIACKWRKFIHDIKTFACKEFNEIWTNTSWYLWRAFSLLGLFFIHCT